MTRTRKSTVNSKVYMNNSFPLCGGRGLEHLMRA
jgi:hypothetical protein